MNSSTENRSVRISNTTRSIINPTNISGLAIGSLALLTNIVILLILLTNRKFLKKSAFIFALAVANFLVGLGYTYSSAYRIILNALGRPTEKTSDAADCLITMIPEIYFLAFSSLAAVLLVNGVERLLAVLTPTWYFAKWKPEKNWYLVAIIYSWVFFWTTAASVNAGLNALGPSVTGLFLTTDCYWNAVAGDGFTVFFFLGSIVGGLGAVLTALASLALGTYRYARLPQLYSSSEVRKRAKRQLQLTKAMLSVAFLDFGLVVIPNTLLVLTFVVNGIPISVVYNSLYMYNANAVLNMLAHVVFNSGFRKAAIAFFRSNLSVCKVAMHLCPFRSSASVSP